MAKHCIRRQCNARGSDRSVTHPNSAFYSLRRRRSRKDAGLCQKFSLDAGAQKGFWHASPRYSKGKLEGLSGEPLRAAAPLAQQKPARGLRQRRWQGVLWEHRSRKRELVGWLDYLLPCCFWYGEYLSRHGGRHQGQPYE